MSLTKVPLPQEEIEHLHGLAEARYPFAVRGIGQPEHCVFELDPAGAQPEFQTAAADVIQRRRLLGQQGRVPECVATNQRTEPHPLCLCRQHGQ